MNVVASSPTDVTGPTAAAAAATPGSSGAPQPARRGRLVLSRAVIERVAAQAASEVAAAGGLSGGVLGFGAAGDLMARPAVTAELVGQGASLALDLTVGYPAPIRETTAAVRKHIIKTVRRLAGVQVTRVDIRVSALTPMGYEPGAVR